MSEKVTSDRFWESKTLFEMTHEEWESICDGCAKCCLTQLQDDETEQLVFTNVACDLLDDNNCLCTDYDNRSERVPSCVTMDAGNVEQAAEFAPPTCSYRLLLQGEVLPDWHHLISQNKNTIHEQDKSVQGKVVFQCNVAEQDYEDHVVEWPV